MGTHLHIDFSEAAPSPRVWCLPVQLDKVMTDRIMMHKMECVVVTAGALRGSTYEVRRPSTLDCPLNSSRRTLLVELRDLVHDRWEWAKEASCTPRLGSIT